MTVAAAGCVSLTLENFRLILAASATFKELMDADNATEAKAVTWWLETDDENDSAQAELPRAVVGFAMGQFESDRISTTGWGTNSPLELLIEVPTPEEYIDDLQNGGIWWLNKIGALIDEVKVLATSGGGYLNVTSFTLDFAGRADPEKGTGGNKYYAAGLTAKARGI